MIDLHDPALSFVIAPDAEVREIPLGHDVGGGVGVAYGKGCNGALWLRELDCLAFNDSGNGRRLTWSPAAGLRVLHSSPGQVIGTARDANGRLIACEWDTGRVVRLEPSGQETTLASRYGEHPLNRPEDVLVVPNGHVWFTDVLGRFPVPRVGAASTSMLYRIHMGDEVIDQAVELASAPGGITLSGDGTEIYVSQPSSQRVLAYELQDDGRVDCEHMRVLCDMTGGDSRAPYGMTVDTNGNIYVGGPGGIWIIDPNGTHLGTIRHPASKTSSLAWGGSDGKTLFFTTSVALGCVNVILGGSLPPGAPDSIPGAHLRLPLVDQRGVEMIDESLDALISADAEVIEVASGGLFDDLGGGVSNWWGRSLEGPVWREDEQCLILSDIGNDRILRMATPGVFEVLYHRTAHANGSTLDVEGRLVSCEHEGRRVVRREHDGTVTVVADRFDGKRLSRPNDVVVRSDGSIYFTAPWWDFGDGAQQEVDFNGFFLVPPDLLSVVAVGRDFDVPNGLCFSLDERKIYVNDTMRMHIRVFDVNEDGSVTPDSGSVFFQMPDSTADAPGKPDGMKMDSRGNLYCGGPRGIWVIDPAGRHLGVIKTGATQSNNFCFGGPRLCTLFIATWHSMLQVEMKVTGAPVPRVVSATPVAAPLA